MGVYPGGAKTARLSSANISEDDLYRYSLERYWALGKALPFIMLNPSTADHTKDDPTIRRCVSFAVALGYSGAVVYNLFAYRTPSPQVLMEMAIHGQDIVGPENDRILSNVLMDAAAHCDPVIVGWGNALPPKFMQPRVDWLKALPGAESMHALGVTKGGHPRHPLYLPADARPHYWPLDPKEKA